MHIKNNKDYENLNLIEKFIYYELLISYNLFNTYGLSFKFDACLDELLEFNKDLYIFIENNNNFFLSLSEDIDKIIHNKSFKTNFEIGFLKLDYVVYTLIIIKSLHIVDNIWLLDYSNISMLHRNVVYRNINKYVKVLELLNIKKAMTKNVFKIIILLEDYVKTKKITIKKKKQKKTKIVTEFYLKLNIIHENSYTNRLVINFSKVKFQMFGEYHVGASYLTLFENIKKSNWQYVKNNFDLKVIDKLVQNPLTFNFEYWPEIRKHITDYYKKKYNIEGDMFKDNVKISNIIDELMLQKSLILETEIEKYKNHRSEIYLKKTANINNSLESTDSNIKNLNNVDWEYWNNKLAFNENIKNIQSDIQKLYYFLIVEKLTTVKFHLFFSYFYDFRGRFYANSSAGFDRLKFARAFFKIKENSNNLDMKNSKYFQNLLNDNVSLNSYFNKFIKNDTDKYWIVLLLLELGKLNKSKIASVNGNSLEDFINLGIDSFWELKNIDVDDLAYYLNIKNSLNHFIHKNELLNPLIIRDSTGSSFQHWGVLLDIKEEFLTKLNLNGNLWYDIYTLIINMFNKSNNYLYNDMKDFFNRKYLKKIIMTANYNAGERLSLENFINALKEDDIPIDDTFKYERFVNDFLSFLNNDLFKILYKQDKLNTLKKIKDDNYKFQTDDGIISLIYFKHTDAKEVVKIAGTRWIFTRKKLFNKVSDWESDMGLPANIIQASDANLARFLVKNTNCLSVHDSFAINAFEIHKLMDLTNFYFNQRLNQNNYSKFILI